MISTNHVAAVTDDRNHSTKCNHIVNPSPPSNDRHDCETTPPATEPEPELELDQTQPSSVSPLRLDQNGITTNTVQIDQTGRELIGDDDDAGETKHLWTTTLASSSQTTSNLTVDGLHNAAIAADAPANPPDASPPPTAAAAPETEVEAAQAPAGGEHRASIGSHRSQSVRRGKTVIRKFQKLDLSQLSSTPSPNVKIGQRVAYKEYYGNEFGTIRWIGRVPQISPDWTVGVEFDNAIGEGDGSLHGRRYFIAKDCFAKFLPLSAVALVDQHVGRPEPGTMISVMAAASQPGQMISIQRVSTVHVQHCFLNAPHRRPTGADILAVNTRLHCQCPNCGPCAHVIKPPTTQRLARAGKNATHMCQFSTYTCCGMESQEETMCTYTGNKVISDLPPHASAAIHLAGCGGGGGPSLPPIGNSWIEGSGYLSQLQAQQRKLMPEEYILGAAPEDVGLDFTPSGHQQQLTNNRSSTTSRRGSGKKHHHQRQHKMKAHAPDESAPNNQDISAEATDQQQQKQPLGCDAAADNDDQSSGHYAQAVACLDKANTFASSETQQTNTSQDHEAAPKAAKVVYRNSIENRYLFPTDDYGDTGDEPIDSTLEEDLENLSQARYGYVNSGGGAGNAAQSGSGRLRSSRGLFKSLRTLVSCLNSQQSEFDVRSENTLRYSDSRHTYNGYTSANQKNRSEPQHYRHGRDSAELEGATDESALYYEESARARPEMVAPPPLYTSSNSNASYSASKRPVVADQCRQTAAAGTRHQRQISSSSDCGFSSASQNSINCLSFAAMSQQQQEDHLRSQQIYQRIVARMMNNNAAITEEDMEKLRNIFIASSAATATGASGGCCLHGQASVSVLSGAEIDQTIAEIATRSLQLQKEHHHAADMAGAASSIRTCCFYSSSQKANCCVGGHNLGTSIQATGNGLANSTMGQCAVSEGQPTVGGTCCVHSKVCASDNSALSRRHADGSVASDSITLSSLGSSGAGNSASLANNLDQPQQPSSKGDARAGSSARTKTAPDEKTSLPKAFELKLTLSINADNKQTGLGSICTDPREQPANVGTVKCRLDSGGDADNKSTTGSQVLDIEIRSPDQLEHQTWNETARDNCQRQATEEEEEKEANRGAQQMELKS